MESKNIFAELVLCFKPNSYNAIKNNGFLKRFLYHLLLTALVFVLAYGVVFAKFNAKTGGLQALTEKYVPDFSLSNGILELERPVEFIEDDVMVIADSDRDFFMLDGTFYDENGTVLGSTATFDSVALIDRTEIIFYNEGQTREMPLSDLTDQLGSFNRSSFVTFLNKLMKAIAVCVFLGVFWAIFAYTIVSAIVLLIIANIQKKQLPIMQLYTISLYARTPITLLFALLNAVGVIVPFKNILIIAITAIYTAFIIKNLDDGEKPVDNYSMETSFTEL